MCAPAPPARFLLQKDGPLQSLTRFPPHLHVHNVTFLLRTAQWSIYYSSLVPMPFYWLRVSRELRDLHVVSLGPVRSAAGKSHLIFVGWKNHWKLELAQSVYFNIHIFFFLPCIIFVSHSDFVGSSHGIKDIVAEALDFHIHVPFCSMEMKTCLLVLTRNSDNCFVQIGSGTAGESWTSHHKLRQQVKSSSKPEQAETLTQIHVLFFCKNQIPLFLLSQP